VHRRFRTDGLIRHVALAHADPAGRRPGSRCTRRAARHVEGRPPRGAALRSGRTRVYTRLPAACVIPSSQVALQNHASGHDLESAMVVPLVARGRRWHAHAGIERLERYGPATSHWSRRSLGASRPRSTAGSAIVSAARGGGLSRALLNGLQNLLPRSPRARRCGWGSPDRSRRAADKRQSRHASTRCSTHSSRRVHARDRNRLAVTTMRSGFILKT